MSDTGVDEPDTGEGEQEDADQEEHCNAQHIIFVFGCDEGTVQQTYHPDPTEFALMFGLAAKLMGGASIGIATHDGEEPSDERMQEIFAKSLRGGRPGVGISVVTPTPDDLRAATADAPGHYL